MTVEERRIQRLYPWLPSELVKLYVSHWTESGDSALAWAEVRAAPAYERWYPGNRRADGTLRMSEAAYSSTIEAYDDVFESVGLNARLFRSQYQNLIEGDVSADELAAERVDPIYERIVEAAPEIMAWYAEHNGLQMTFEAILAARLDPDVIGVKILNREIGMAEIGGTAVGAGFGDVDLGLVERLYERDITKAQAEQVFGEARNFVPVLNVLAARHADPDDEFDLQDFTASEVFSDPVQRRRMRRLVAQERSTFTGGGVGTFAQERATGNVAGLNRPV
jgi:hypothetical protein